MWLTSWLQNVKAGAPRTRCTRGRRTELPSRLRFGPRLEALECRALPSCTLSLVPNEPAPQLVGEPVLWTAKPDDCGKGLVYQFNVRPSGDAFRVVRDFSPDNTFTWTPMQEGSYEVRVTAKEGYQATETFSTTVSDAVDSRVTGSYAVITPTSNPLVALYSAPPSSGDTIEVQFTVAGPHPEWRSTNTLPIEPGKSANFFVAGLLPNTTYKMRHVVTSYHHHHHSPSQIFTTGAIPPSLVFPSFTVQQPPGPGSDLDQDLISHSLPTSPMPFVTDLQGRVVWYFDVQHSGLGISSFGTQTFEPGGTVLGFGRDRYSVRNNQDVLREIDLAGNPVRETNLAAVNAQLTALGHEISYGFHHDAQRLPNGDTVVLGLTERKIDINGTPTNYIGDMIVVLDEDLQVAWVWDAFDHLDVNRGPVLGEIVHQGEGGPDSIVPNYPAVSWLHDNAVSLSPADGNLILSVRHQDWVIKIDYENGEGDGHIIWKLGQDGDFSVNSTDPSPWFSHQHNAHYIDDSTLILFDNGNTRRASDPNAHSRGQVWRLDEQTMTATLLLNADLGNSSDALGAAQRLSNGNFSFTSGFQGQPPNQFGQSIEVGPDGTQTYILQVDALLYRSFRVRTLYEGTGDSLSAGGGRCRSAGSSQRGSVPSSASDPAAAHFGPTAAGRYRFDVPLTQAAGQLDTLRATVVLPIPEQLTRTPPPGTIAGALSPLEGTAIPTPVITLRHAQDAVFAELADPLLDTRSLEWAP